MFYWFYSLKKEKDKLKICAISGRINKRGLNLCSKDVSCYKSRIIKKTLKGSESFVLCHLFFVILHLIPFIKV